MITIVMALSVSKFERATHSELFLVDSLGHTDVLGLMLLLLGFKVGNDGDILLGNSNGDILLGNSDVLLGNHKCSLFLESIVSNLICSHVTSSNCLCLILCRSRVCSSRILCYSLSFFCFAGSLSFSRCFLRFSLGLGQILSSLGLLLTRYLLLLTCPVEQIGGLLVISIHGCLQTLDLLINLSCVLLSIGSCLDGLAGGLGLLSLRLCQVLVGLSFLCLCLFLRLLSCFFLKLLRCRRCHSCHWASPEGLAELRKFQFVAVEASIIRHGTLNSRRELLALLSLVLFGI